MAGSSNYECSDNQYALNANLYNVNTFSTWKLWYGGGITFGLYDGSSQETYPDSLKIINMLSGNKFYGSINGNAGVTYALQLGNIEWRILGFEITGQEEFGDFLQFRRRLANEKVPANGNVTNAFLLTAGLSTELCIAFPNGSFNILEQYNILTGKNYRYLVTDYINDYFSYKIKRYDYFSSTYSVTVKNMTYFLQGNIQPFWKYTDDGPRMFNIQAGINYRLPAKESK